MLTLEWRPRAQLDRKSIAIYLGVEKQDPDLALKTIKKLDDAISILLDLPDMGGWFHAEHLERDYRTIMVNPYVIYYRYTQDTLTIYRIVHQRQDIDTYTLVDL